VFDESSLMLHPDTDVTDDIQFISIPFCYILEVNSIQFSSFLLHPVDLTVSAAPAAANSTSPLCPLPCCHPSCRCGCRHTQTQLNVSDNCLCYLPEGLGGLTSLCALRASNNTLLELPDSLTELQVRWQQRCGTLNSCSGRTHS
jgi:hypothetical protein